MFIGVYEQLCTIVFGVTYSRYSATVHVFDGTLMICWCYGEGGVGWGGVGGLITFKYTSTHTSCYATAGSSCTSTHTSCYAAARSSCHTRHATLLHVPLALAHTRHATLLRVLLALPHTRHATLLWMKNKFCVLLQFGTLNDDTHKTL